VVLRAVSNPTVKRVRGKRLSEPFNPGVKRGKGSREPFNPGVKREKRLSGAF